MESVQVSIPLETEVIRKHHKMVLGTRFMEDEGVIYAEMDIRRGSWTEMLGLPSETKIHWADLREVEIKEVSAMLRPIRYRLTYGDGWYRGEDGERHYFAIQPHLEGIDLLRRCTTVTLRTAVLLAVMAGVGLRTVCWLMKILFHLEVTKSSLDRWVKECAARLPDAEGMAKVMHADKAISEGHFDEIFAKGQRPKRCTLVLRDEHGRIFAAKEIENRDEDTVYKFLNEIKGWGIKIERFYVDGCDAYKNAIPRVFPDATIQYDYFHVIQNIWKKLWKSVVDRRRTIKKRAESSKSKAYSKRLKRLAKKMWKKRHLFFKKDKNMSDLERQELLKFMEIDCHIRTVRNFVEAVWEIFENSKTQEDANKALEKLKCRPEVKPDSVYQKAVNFLESRFLDMTSFLRHSNVKRNSLAETGIRCLRRLEQGHDGFRGSAGLDRYLRIYQAIKYCGWSVHRCSHGLGLPPQKQLEIAS